MEEQQLADCFSEQVDRMLDGESTTIPSDAEDLQELLDIVGQPTLQTEFQAGPAAQTGFQSQLADWFGLANGESPMTILGLSKTWFISIVVTVIMVMTGAGLIAVMATSIFVFSASSQLPPTTEPTVEPTNEPTTEPSGEPTTEPTGEPTTEPTSEPTTEPDPPSPDEPTLIFGSNILIIQLCQGAYTTQRTLINYGHLPVTNASLIWEVIEGTDLVDDVSIGSASLVQSLNENGAAPANASPATNMDTTSASVTGNSSTLHSNFADFGSISAQQKIKLKVKVKVKDKWWNESNGTQIKVKLSIKNKGKFKAHNGHSQIITIVKQDAEWMTLTGVAHNQGNQTLLVDGSIVAINNCTGLPPTLPPGSNVQVIGLLQPDGTFLAININIINIIINGDFDSGVSVPGDDDDDNDDDSGGGGGGNGSCCGKGGGKGGSRGGS